ncbi:hypothetical protein BN1051_03217 [Arthrobacter saudimassiliensis]|uniref:NlpC/P60 domain-containing protein n=1 Tax=Arthrobacter saudimassiliensis TaxID=1461584 RepID=A0A078MRJ1_9MICC|nr:hypothetical protein BN1051_03217 [Arthrobacter saudimassiliensis]
MLAAGIPAQAAPSTERQALEALPLNIVTGGGALSVPADAPFQLAGLEQVVSESGAVERAAAEQAAAEQAAAEQAAAVAAERTAVQQAAAPAPAAPAQAAPAPAVEVAVQAAPAASAVADILVGSAYSQIGVAQDCTAMVEKALRAAGKSVGDLAPAQFYAYGSVVGSPMPGDLVITPGHVAIYVGNGQVISGGFNGFNTALHNLSDLPGASFVRVS